MYRRFQDSRYSRIVGDSGDTGLNHDNGGREVPNGPQQTAPTADSGTTLPPGNTNITPTLNLTQTNTTDLVSLVRRLLDNLERAPTALPQTSSEPLAQTSSEPLAGTTGPIPILDIPFQPNQFPTPSWMPPFKQQRRTNSRPTQAIQHVEVRSNNADFLNLVRLSRDAIQLQHCCNNWSKLPKVVTLSIDRLQASIRPPKATFQLEQCLESLFEDFKSNLQRLIQDETLKSLRSTQSKLAVLNQEDRDQAYTVAVRNVKRSLPHVRDTTIKQALTIPTVSAAIRPPSLPFSTSHSSPSLSTPVSVPRPSTIPRPIQEPHKPRHSPPPPEVSSTLLKRQRLDAQVLTNIDNLIELHEDQAPLLHPPLTTASPDQQLLLPSATLESVHHEVPQATPCLRPSPSPASVNPPQQQRFTRSSNKSSAIRMFQSRDKFREFLIPKLETTTDTLVLASSNAGSWKHKIPDNYQVLGFCGGDLHHLHNMLSKWTPPEHLKWLIIHMGMNSRLQSQEEITRIVTRIHDVFSKWPQLQVLASAVPYLPTASLQQDDGARQINHMFIRLFNNYLPPPERCETRPKTGTDDSHYDSVTAEKIFASMRIEIGRIMSSKK